LVIWSTGSNKSTVTDESGRRSRAGVGIEGDASWGEQRELATSEGVGEVTV
jgi:hypothetical protein